MFVSVYILHDNFLARQYLHVYAYAFFWYTIFFLVYKAAVFLLSVNTCAHNFLYRLNYMNTLIVNFLVISPPTVYIPVLPFSVMRGGYDEYIIEIVFIKVQISWSVCLCQVFFLFCAPFFIRSLVWDLTSEQLSWAHWWIMDLDSDGPNPHGTIVPFYTVYRKSYVCLLAKSRAFVYSFAMERWELVVY